VDFRRRATVNIKTYAQALHAVFDELVVAVNDGLRRDALFARADGDGHAVFVAAADKHHVFALQAQVAHVDVGRHVNARQVTDVHGAVGVWQRRCH